VPNWFQGKQDFYYGLQWVTSLLMLNFLGPYFFLKFDYKVANKQAESVLTLSAKLKIVKFGYF
jgi:hypothetical protein